MSNDNATPIGYGSSGIISLRKAHLAARDAEAKAYLAFLAAMSVNAPYRCEFVTAVDISRVAYYAARAASGAVTAAYIAAQDAEAAASTIP